MTNLLFLIINITFVVAFPLFVAYTLFAIISLIYAKKTNNKRLFKRIIKKYFETV